MLKIQIFKKNIALNVITPTYFINLTLLHFIAEKSVPFSTLFIKNKSLSEYATLKNQSK